jgi:Putative phage tail protein
MGRWVAGLFGPTGKQKSTPAATLRVQTSLYGQPRPILVAGQQRMAGNLLWFGGLNSVTDTSSGALGGKGGMFSAGAAAGANQYYYAAIDFALCEGPVAAVVAIWPRGTARNINSWAASYDTTAIGVSPTVFLGTLTQTAWSYIVNHNPTQALGHRGLAHVGVVNFPLGEGAILPNVNWEVQAINSYALGGANPDGDPSIATSDWLTNPFWGVPGFPAARVGSLALYQSYCLANGLLVSPAVSSPIQASSFLTDLWQATNSNGRWSGGQLSVIPYGDQPVVVGQVQQSSESYVVASPRGANGRFITTVNNAATFVANVSVVYTATGALLTQVNVGGQIVKGAYLVTNGVYQFNVRDKDQGITITYTWSAVASYVPQTQPIYALTPDHFLPYQGSAGAGGAPRNIPLLITRKPKDQMLTSIRVEYLNRTNNYNPDVIEIKDEAAINLYGRERPGDVRQLHNLCLSSVAQFAATQMLVRANIARDYHFTLGRQFILLDVMDIVTVTDPAQNVFNQPVRINEITENDDRSLTFDAEEFTGTASAPLFGVQAPGGYIPANAALPGNINPPIIFEPTAELLGGAGQEVWCGVSGGPNWGGCVVWVSTDGGVNYKQLPGQSGGCRMGVTTTALPAVPVNLVGQTIDTTTALGVDLTQSAGTLLSASSAADAQNLTTACLVGSEVLAYQNATLTTQFKYSLSYLVRGAYGTEAAISGQPAGVPFLRLDAGVLQVPFDNNQIGTTILLKFQSFNLYGEQLQSLANVAAYPFMITGVAQSSPLPTVQNVVSTTVNNRLVMSWDEIGANDFRNGIFYEIRAGSTPQGSMTLGIVAHPPFVFPAGTNTYWISGWCQPVPGLIVRSEAWAEISVTNAQVTTNIIASFNYQCLGWPGTFTGGAGIDTTLNAVRTGGSGNILVSDIIEIMPLAGIAISGHEQPSHPIASPHCSRETKASTFSVTSGTYVSGTGVTTLVIGSSPGLLPGDGFTLSALTGTGGFASLDGTWIATAGTTGTTVVFTGPTGLGTTTITGGTLSLVADFAISVTATMEQGRNVGDTLWAYPTSYYVNPNILDFGGQQNGAYFPGTVVNIGRVDTCPIYFNTVGTGVPVGQDILSINDILAVQDILGSASSQYVNVYPVINVAQANGVFAGFQKFVPGSYTGQFFQPGWMLMTDDPTTIAYLLTGTFAVDVPNRTDHPLVNGIVTSAGLAIVYAPDSNPSVPAAFNGGPGGAALPAVEVTWSGSDAASGDYALVTLASASGSTVTIYNSSNVAVTRHNVSIYVFGW